MPLRVGVDRRRASIEMRVNSKIMQPWVVDCFKKSVSIKWVRWYFIAGDDQLECEIFDRKCKAEAAIKVIADYVQQKT